MTPRYLLEDDFELWLVNAQHVKNVPAPDCLRFERHPPRIAAARRRPHGERE
jgi:hypothetical protein